MKINREEFNRLPQLDRIEFRQIYERIFENTNWFALMAFLLVITDHTILGWIFLAIAIIFFFKAKKKTNLLEKSYFTTQVKRNVRRDN